MSEIEHPVENLNLFNKHTLTPRNIGRIIDEAMIRIIPDKDKAALRQ